MLWYSFFKTMRHSLLQLGFRRHTVRRLDQLTDIDISAVVFSSQDKCHTHFFNLAADFVAFSTFISSRTWTSTILCVVIRTVRHSPLQYGCLQHSVQHLHHLTHTDTDVTVQWCSVIRTLETSTFSASLPSAHHSAPSSAHWRRRQRFSVQFSKL